MPEHDNMASKLKDFVSVGKKIVAVGRNYRYYRNILEARTSALSDVVVHKMDTFRIWHDDGDNTHFSRLSGPGRPAWCSELVKFDLGVRVHITGSHSPLNMPKDARTKPVSVRCSDAITSSR